MATEYGKRLRQARKLAKLTQAELSKKTGIAQSTISTAEREGAGSSDTAVYANACGVSALWLSTGDGEMQPSNAFHQPENQVQSVFAKERRAAFTVITVDVAVQKLAQHLESLEGYDKPTAISLLTTLANSPGMHDVVAAGLKALKPEARSNPSKQPQPAPAWHDHGAA